MSSPIMPRESFDESLARARELVERCLRSVLPVNAQFPGEDEDWIASGLLDSMGHVDVLSCMESAAARPDLFAKMSTPPSSIRSASEAVAAALAESVASAAATQGTRDAAGTEPAGLTGWGAALGARCVPIDEVEREFSLPPGRLGERAGIASVRRALPEEDEVSLGAAAARDALRTAGITAQSLDWIIATGETLLGFPSLAASLHSALLAPGGCQALDVGGACAGLVNGLAVARAFFAGQRVHRVLVVSADVHSRILAPGKVAGKFGGLFGDGASAFVLARGPASAAGDAAMEPYAIRETIGGCAGTFRAALQIRRGPDDSIVLDFDGEALARAAVDRLGQIVTDLETRAGVRCEQASAFAIHQPNPRLVDIFHRRMNLSATQIPQVARTCGNLGSSTCGVALSTALDEHAKKTRSERGPIFVAALGPGLLWGGALLE